MNVFGMVSLAVTAVAAYFAYRALLPPKRHLTVSVLPSIPLLGSTDLASLGIRVTREGRTLDDARLVSVTLTNTGTHDVTSGAFHGGVPFVVALDTPVEVLQVTQGAERAVPMPCVAHGTELRIGPGLVARGDRVVIQALTQGAPADPPRVRHELVDVEVGLDSAPGRRRRLLVAALMSVIIGGEVAALVASAAAVRPDREPKVVASQPAVRRGDHFGLVGVHLADFCPVEVRAYNRLVARGQTDGDGFLSLVVDVAQDAPLGRTNVRVLCNDEQRALEYRTTIAIVRE